MMNNDKLMILYVFSCSKKTQKDVWRKCAEEKSCDGGYDKYK